MIPAVEQYARRGLLALAVGVVAAFLSWHAHASVLFSTDFAQIWHAARGWLDGRNPYEVVGRHGSFSWPFPLLYPGTAVVAAVPFAWLPLRLASAAFVGVGSGVLAWALSAPSRAVGPWWLFASAAFVSVVRTAQWSPLLMASALVSPLGWLLTCKPSVGLALFAAYPSRRAAALGAGFVAVSVAVLPTWPRDWLAALPSAYHMSAPVTYVSAGGPLVLLALLRWQRPEARLLVALACIPHTTMLYEALPLFLVARRWQEGMLLALASWACMDWQRQTDYLQMMHTGAWKMTLLLYLPCVVMVLRRTNTPGSERQWTAERQAESMRLTANSAPSPIGIVRLLAGITLSSARMMRDRHRPALWSMLKPSERSLDGFNESSNQGGPTDAGQ